MADQILLRQAWDSNGDPLNGAKAYFFQTGTTTQISAFSDEALTAAVSQPLLSDAAGRFAQTYWVGGAAVKVRYDTAADVTFLTEDPAPTVSTSTSAASDISFTPAGTISSTNVQDAIEEVAGEATLPTTLTNTATNQSLTLAGRSNGYRCTADVTLTLAAAATLGSGWFFTVIADGGDATVDCDGSETVNGQLTQVVPDGSTATIRCDGSSLYMDVVRPDPVGQCDFQNTSATICTLVPRDGNLIRIAGLLYSIPTAGVTIDATESVFDGGSAGADTVYNIYAYVSSGVLTLEASATARATDTAGANVGVEIKSGDATRTIVGKVRTNASSQFVDTAAERGVISWFNRRRILAEVTESGALSTINTSAEKVGTDVEWIDWGEDAAELGFLGSCYNALAGANVYSFLYLNGARTKANAWSKANTTGVYPMPCHLRVGEVPAEGYNFAALWGQITSNTGHWTGISDNPSTQVEFWG